MVYFLVPMICFFTDLHSKSRLPFLPKTGPSNARSMAKSRNWSRLKPFSAFFCWDDPCPTLKCHCKPIRIEAIEVLYAHLDHSKTSACEANWKAIPGLQPAMLWEPWSPWKLRGCQRWQSETEQHASDDPMVTKGLGTKHKRSQETTGATTWWHNLKQIHFEYA